MNVDFLKEKGRKEISKAAGVTVNTARYWIEGKTSIKVDDALRIARYFGVPIQKVIGVEYDDSPTVIAALDAENRILKSEISVLTEKLRMIQSIIGEEANSK